MPRRGKNVRRGAPGRGSASRDAQLCRQVAEALSLALMEASSVEDDGADGDDEADALDGLYIAEVVPWPSTSRLLVRVGGLPRDRAPSTALARLEVLRGVFRSEVAQAIHRKTTPELAFEVLPPGPDGTRPPEEPPENDDGEGHGGATVRTRRRSASTSAAG